jgi:acetyl esterase/lipase
MPRKNGVGLAALGRLVAGTIVCGAGLLATMSPETTLMWRASIILTEWGHWLGLLSVLLLLKWHRSWLHGTAATLTTVGIVLLLIPLARAYDSAATLADDLHATFGIPRTISTTDALPRPQPLVASDLMFGVSAGDVIVDEHVYDVVDGERLALDLYRPVFGVDSRPVVMVIHGGGWTDGTKREFQNLSRYLAARGYVVANIDYRLAPGHLFPAPQEDLLAAIRYVKDLETTHGVDPTRIALLGRSVGGQIAMLGAYTSTDPSIRGVISLYGPAALRWGYRNPAKEQVVDSGAVLEDYLGGPPDTHGAQYDAAEPARFVTSTSPPTLFIHGLRDEHVSPFHAEIVSTRLLEEGVPHVVLRLPWATHGCDFVFSGPCGQVTTFAVEQFLGSVLHGLGSEAALEDPIP